MTFAGGEQHVYLRAMAQGERTSLSVLAGMVPAGSRVLDLGTGSGALGQYLGQQAGCTVDGVTINEQEAAIARPHYRRVEVADLEQPDWTALFTGETYDRIICADVLEHLRQPEKALNACRSLLAPGGQVLISVPNAAYCGLVAELLEGDFTYREEGLLDRTHLRFFTRRSLQLFLEGQGWRMDAFEPISVPLTDSEFRGAFHRLPPAVARYLLALPEAGTYQLVVATHPSSAPAELAQRSVAAPAAALFSAQVYLGENSGFNEERKVVTTGVMGLEQQTLRFVLPLAGRVPDRLRLDPADRPGFLRLRRIQLSSDARLLWQWSCEDEGLAALENTRHQDMVLRAPWPGASALVLVHGDDPFLDLPIPHDVLERCARGGETVLEVAMGWPMSADYMALVEVIEPLRKNAEAERVRGLQDMEEAQRRFHQVEVALAEANMQIGQLTARQEVLRAESRLLTDHNKAVIEEKNLIARHRLALQADLADLSRQHEALAQHLRWIEQSTVFRLSRPLVKAKMGIERLLGRRPPQALAQATQVRPVAPPDAPVDVIVPVYRGLEDTQRCIRAVLASTCRTPWRLVVLNDASPEPEVTQWLREVSQGDPRILLLENEHNLGFVGTVNRGMSVSAENDALLLNSDTEVANDWLDRLRAAAYGDARVATVTPFSNNATICSYPRFCEPNELPPGCDTAGLDAFFASTNAGQVVDVPTGVGFCMYIRRDALTAVGLFDVEQFGKGYGEENDFCRRAADAGWRNLHALDTFVLHTGGVSFGDSKSQRERDAVEKLRRLHPSYDRLVHDFVRADPAFAARHAVDLARVRQSGLPTVLAVLHSRGGGTLRHVLELAEHLRGKASFFSVTPAPGHAVWLELLERGAGFRLEFSLPAQWPALLHALRSLGAGHIHYHSVLGHRDEILALGEALGLPWDFTAHDFYTMCPQITLTDRTDRYCGEEGDGQCRRCVEHTPAPGGLDIGRWRERHGKLVTQARHVLVPSRDTARRFVRMWGSGDVRLAPHTDIASPGALPVPQVAPLAPHAPLRIAVLGGLSKIKGADLLEDVAVLAARAGAPVEFHLIGHAYRQLHKQPRAALTVHGAYQESELPSLLAWLKPDLVWFPALWPETYSYTLSACLEAGLPVVAPNLGAFPERLSGRKWSWVLPWAAPAPEWLSIFLAMREKHFVAGVSPPAHWDVAPTAQDVGIGNWCYATDYLAGIPRPTATRDVLGTVFLEAHRPGQGEGLERGRRRLKHLALSSLVRLRATAPLRGVARAIPLRWQTRVKSWLRA